MKTLGQIEYVSDWNGGYYTLDDVRISIHRNIIDGNDINNLCLKIKGEIYPVGISVEYGEDHDMGHVYKWSINHICYVATVPLLGETKTPVKQLFEETKIRKVYLLEKD